jgi:hypothetical protein
MDSKAGQDQISRGSCLGSINAYVTSARNRVSFLESDWNQLVSIAVREGIALSEASNVGATELPTLATHTFTPINAQLVGLVAQNISLNDQRRTFCSHCARIEPIVSQVQMFGFFFKLIVTYFSYNMLTENWNRSICYRVWMQSNMR